MKIEKIGNCDYQIMISNSFLKEEDSISMIDRFLSFFSNKMKLKGFYRIVVFSRFFGLFFQMLKVDDSYYKDSFDYRIVFDYDSCFFFQTEDYSVVESCHTIYYHDGYYYGLVDDSFDGILEKVEFGCFIMEKDIDFSQLLLISK